MASNPNKTYINLYVGTYAQANEGGIYHLVFSTESEQLEINDFVDGVTNPSYLTIDAINNRLYAVSETETGGIVSYLIDRSGFKLKEINRRFTNGADPCFVSLDSKEGTLYFVNYSGGSLGVFPILKDGTIGELRDFVQLNGQSVNTDRQDAPYQVSLDGTFIPAFPKKTPPCVEFFC